MLRKWFKKPLPKPQSQPTSKSSTQNPAAIQPILGPTPRTHRALWRSRAVHPPTLATTHSPPAKAKTLTLWEQALSRVRPEDIEGVDMQGNGNPSLLLQDMIQVTEQTKSEMEAKRWVYKNTNGEEVSYADTFLTVMNKYGKIVDIAMQYDPSVVAVVWSGFRVLLKVAPADMNNVQMIFGSLESLVRILYRCDIFEKLYAERELQATEQLKSSLVNLYVAVLEYLCCARRDISLKTPLRMLKSLVSDSGELFNKFQQCEGEVLNDADTAEKEAAGAEGYAQDERTQSLKRLLVELQEPIQQIARTVAQLNTHVEKETRSKVLQWLSVVPYRDHHTLSQERRRQGTGDWLLQNDKFWAWRNSSKSALLWLRGNAGAGKTILASRIIDEFLLVPRTSNGRDALAYFYCYYGEESRKDSASILRTLVKQLCLIDPGLPKSVLAVFKEREDSGHQSGPLLPDESRDLIIALSAEFSQTTIIIDALDECHTQTRKTLFRILKQIVTRTKHVRIFLTSRSDGEIQRMLGDFPSHYLDAADNAGDINTFITTEINRCVGERLLLDGVVGQDLRSEIISTLEKGACGMFMWVHLQILAICLEQTVENVRSALSTLPQGLDETYSRILKNIAENQSPRTGYAVDMILKWILYAEDLCSPELIIGVLAVTPGEAAPDTSSWTLEKILHICHNFVVYDQTLDILRFAHFSVHEFLAHQPTYEPEPCQTAIAEVCLTVLTYSSESSPDTALRTYSTVHWTAHLRLSGRGSKTLEDLWKGFLSPQVTPSPAYQSWGTRFLKKENRGQYTSPLQATVGVVPPLWVACYYQLNVVFKFLLENGAIVDCQSKTMDIPFGHAASKGYIDFVRLLIQKDAGNSSHQNSRGLTALALAVEGNHMAVVTILLQEEGVELNTKDRWGDTPLATASRCGFNDIVHLMLERDGVELNALNSDGMTPLGQASASGCANVVQVLLKKGVELIPRTRLG